MDQYSAVARLLLQFWASLSDIQLGRISNVLIGLDLSLRSGAADINFELMTAHRLKMCGLSVPQRQMLVRMAQALQNGAVLQTAAAELAQATTPPPGAGETVALGASPVMPGTVVQCSNTNKERSGVQCSNRIPSTALYRLCGECTRRCGKCDKILPIWFKFCGKCAARDMR